MRPFLAVPLLLLAAFAAQADTRYVSDQLEITLRAGESTRYKIIRMLPSGTALDVLSVNEGNDYARVRSEDGTVGFVLQRQLQEEPVARTRLTEMEARLAELQQQPDALSARLAALQSEHADLNSRYQALERDKQRIEQEYATIRHASANVLDITSDRERLRIQVAELTRERADLQQENRDLKNQSDQRWFMIGASVLAGGVLLGLVLPHLRLRQRKSSWGTL